MSAVMKHKPTPGFVARTNERLALIHTNAAALLQRIHDSRGNPSLRDCAMAGVFAQALDKRRKTVQEAPRPD